jgi:erythromycin esterase-like protein
MSSNPAISAVEVVRSCALPLAGAAAGFDPLLDLIGDARFVLIGEASHGTHEFYRDHAAITRPLIEEKSFTVAGRPAGTRAKCRIAAH